MLRKLTKFATRVPKLAQIQGPANGLFKLNRYASFRTTSPACKAAFNGESAVFAEQMYDNWKSDPSSVDKSWDSYFQGFEFGSGAVFSTLP